MSDEKNKELEEQRIVEVDAELVDPSELTDEENQNGENATYWTRPLICRFYDYTDNEETDYREWQQSGTSSTKKYSFTLGDAANMAYWKDDCPNFTPTVHRCRDHNKGVTDYAPGYTFSNYFEQKFDNKNATPWYFTIRGTVINKVTIKGKSNYYWDTSNGRYSSSSYSAVCEKVAYKMKGVKDEAADNWEIDLLSYDSGDELTFDGFTVNGYEVYGCNYTTSSTRYQDDKTKIKTTYYYYITKVNFSSYDTKSGNTYKFIKPGDYTSSSLENDYDTEEETYYGNYIEYRNASGSGIYDWKEDFASTPDTKITSTFTIIDGPSVSGKKFLGWSRNSGASYADYTVGQKVTLTYEILILYPVYIDHTKIVYDANGHGTAPKTIELDGKYTFKPADLVAPSGDTPHFTFVEWRKNGVKVNPGETVSGNVTLIAYWQEDPKYTIMYDNNGHGTQPSSKTEYVGYEIKQEDLPVLTDSDYIFVDWYDNPDFSGEPVKPGKILDSNITLYAQWSRMVHITYDNNGHGIQPQSKNTTENPHILSKENDLPVLSDNDYIFKGWLKEDGSEPVEGEILTEDVNFIAQWVIKVHITYHSEYGEVPEPINTEENPHILKESELPKLSLPYEYQEVKWLQSTGKQRIDTKITPNDIYGKQIKFIGQNVDESESHDALFFGVWQGGGTDQGIQFYNYNKRSYTVDNIINYTIIPNNPSSINEEFFLEGICNSKNENNIYLFSRNRTDGYIDSKVSNGLLHLGNNILKPCYHKENNKAGYYNLTTNEFLIDINGEEDFIIGPAVEYTFLGWYYDEDFNQEAFAGNELIDNVDLYAKWTDQPIRTLEYISEYDIEHIPPVRYLENSYILKESDLPKLSEDTHFHLGWFNEETGEEYLPGYVVNSDIILTAKWIDKPWLRYSSFPEAGKPEDKMIDSYPYYIKEEDLPELEQYGYRFDGWYYIPQEEVISNVNN